MFLHFNQPQEILMTDKKSKHNYTPAVEAAIRRWQKQGKITCDEAYYVSIVHDDWCDLLKHEGPCNCDPEIRLESGQ